MKDSRATVIVSAFVLLVFLLFCVRPARAALPPTQYVPPTSYTVYETHITPPASTANSYPVSLPSSSGNLVPITTDNNLSRYSGTGGLSPVAVPGPSGTGIEIPATQQVTIAESPGSVPITAVPEVPTAVFNETINMGGGGAGSPASVMTENALKIGGAAAGLVVGSPLTKLASAVTLGTVGYQLYKALEGQGITANPDGSASLAANPQIPNNGYCLAGTTRVSMAEYCDITLPSPHLPCSGSDQCIGTASIPPNFFNPQPATYQNLVDALNKATQSLNVAADAINWSLSQGVPIPAGRPVTSVPPSVTLSGSPTLTQTTQDTTGNTTKTYTQPTSNISPAQTTGTPPSVTPGSRVTNTVNNSPTTITNNFSPPMIFSPPLSGGGGGLPQPDLCAVHPDILACSNDANVGDVASQALAVSPITIPSSLTPVTMPSGLLCPAPIVLVNSFGRMEVWDISSKLCAFLLMIKPIVLAFAWLSAASIVMLGKAPNV